ncbi:MAG TPA: hypothetical protein VMT79_21240 [Candidatus Binatia bacterium]|jgi:branched-subunit amino acid transport protein|nr:hypothetical protein [Candidatus Binatia bacterium]
MSPVVLAGIALITYASRAAALVFLRKPGGRFAAILGRMPAPIFASLATLSLVTADGSLARGPILWAALGALAASSTRSLPLCLVGGLAGYALGQALS